MANRTLPDPVRAVGPLARPALRELAYHLTEHDVCADPRDVAAALLDVVCAKLEHGDAAEVMRWFKQLAADVVP